MSKERQKTYDEGVGPDLEETVLSVFDEVLVVEVLKEKTHPEAGVGDCCLKGLKRFSKYTRSMEDHRFDGLRDCPPEPQSRQWDLPTKDRDTP